MVSIPQTRQMIGRCTATVYELAGAKVLDAVKSDGRTLITMDSIKRYVASLPACANRTAAATQAAASAQAGGGFNPCPITRRPRLRAEADM